jgi:FkbM family methyltransferase
MRRFRWALWHPHQKLWNWTLERGLRRLGPLSRLAVWTLVTVDTGFLLARVQARSRMRRGPQSTANSGGSKPRMLYIDCGTHKHGEQIRLIHSWYADRYDLHVIGFEASSEHFRDVSAELAGLPGVQLYQVALVGPDYTDDRVRLYKAGGDGKADSLFAERDVGEYEDVPAKRLTQILADEGYDLHDIPVILRMNIEGAEQYVVADLIDAGQHREINGYYGMWDDLSKMDPQADKRFRRVLREHGISTITFNDRDLQFRLRQRAIRTDIESALRRPS